MVLRDGELEGGFEDRFGGGGLSVLKEGFAEEDAGEHPIVTGLHAAFEVGNGGEGFAFFSEGLGEAEAEKYIVGLGFDLRNKEFGFFHGNRVWVL